MMSIDICLFYERSFHPSRLLLALTLLLQLYMNVTVIHISLC